MKTLARLMVPGIALALLQACELSGNPLPSNSFTTSTGAVFSLTPVQSTAPGFFQSFNVSGTSSAGDTFSGTFSVQNLPATTFGGQPAVPRTRTLALTNQQTNGFTTTQQTLFLAPGFQVVGASEDLTGVRCSPLAPLTTMPVSAGVGSNGVLGSLSCSDGTTLELSWRVDGTTGGRAVLVLVTGIRNGGIQLTTEEDGFVIDTNGAIHGVTVTSQELATGVTINLESPLI